MNSETSVFRILLRNDHLTDGIENTSIKDVRPLFNFNPFVIYPLFSFPRCKFTWENMKRFVLNTHTTYSCQGLLKFLWKEESVVAKRCVHYSRASDKAIQLSVKKAKLIANVEANVYVCTHLSLISSFFFQTKTIVPTCFWPLSKQLSFPTASV